MGGCQFGGTQQTNSWFTPKTSSSCFEYLTKKCPSVSIAAKGDSSTNIGGCDYYCYCFCILRYCCTTKMDMNRFHVVGDQAQQKHTKGRDATEQQNEQAMKLF